MRSFVRAAALGNYAEIARRVGLDPHQRLRAAGIDPVYLADSDMRVSIEAVAILLEDSARRSGCETLGLEMAEDWRLSDLGVVSLLLAHEQSVRSALAAADGYRHLLNDSVTLSVDDAGNLAMVREELVGAHAARSRQANELVTGVLLKIFRAILGSSWRPLGVRFAHSAPRRLNVHRRFFAAPVAFDQDVNGITCRLADLDLANPARDRGLTRHARRLLDMIPGSRSAEDSSAQDVLRAIHILLPVGKATIAQVARGTALTPRTLQRQLDLEGTSFSELLNQVRRDMVPRYLANPAFSVLEVGQLLGYEFPSSFTRWFRSEFGCSPQRWRQEHAGGSSRT
jgi:AraC-like DNA-binding protein